MVEQNILKIGASMVVLHLLFMIISSFQGLAMTGVDLNDETIIKNYLKGISTDAPNEVYSDDSDLCTGDIDNCLTSLSNDDRDNTGFVDEVANVINLGEGISNIKTFVGNTVFLQGLLKDNNGDYYKFGDTVVGLVISIIMRMLLFIWTFFVFYFLMKLIFPTRV